MAGQFTWLSPRLSLVISAALWGVVTVFAKELLGSVPPILFLGILLAPSVLALWIIVLAQRPVLVSWRSMTLVALLGWLNPGLSYTLTMLGLVHSSASVATLLWAVEPALIVVLAGLLLRERITPALALLTATAGVGATMASGATDPGILLSEGGLGAALIFAGALCCAVYNVISRRIVEHTEPLLMVAVQQAVGLAWAVAIWPLEWRASGIAPLLALTAREWLGGIACGLMYYALAYWLYLVALRSMPVSRAGNFFNLIPLFGIAGAHVFLGERLSAVQWAGAVIILASVIALQTRLASARSGAPTQSAA
jgi:drug/metabolite transporter (DMT)-like permease